MRILKDIEKGIGIAIGFFLIAGIVFGVYAFVEPMQSPSAGSNYMPSSSPITIKLNNIASNVTAINNKYGGCFWTGETTCGTGFVQIRTSTQGFCNSIFTQGGSQSYGYESSFQVAIGINSCSTGSYYNSNTVRLCCSN